MDEADLSGDGGHCVLITTGHNARGGDDMGDKGGKKDKEKSKQQQATKQKQADQKKQDKTRKAP